MGSKSLAREEEAARRGGVVRYRTMKMPGGKYTHLAITKEAGPRGGHTLAGTVHEKGSGPHRMTSEMKKAHRDAPKKRRKRKGRHSLRDIA